MMERSEYDELGRIIRKVEYDENETITEDIRLEYDVRGKEIAEYTVDASGVPAPHYRWRYDQRGRHVERRVVDSNLKATDQALVEWTYDASSNLVEKVSKDKKGRLTRMSKLDDWGCAIVRWSGYDGRQRAGRYDCINTDKQVVFSADRAQTTSRVPVLVDLRAEPPPWFSYLTADKVREYGFANRRDDLLAYLRRSTEASGDTPPAVISSSVIDAMSRIEMELFVLPWFWNQQSEDDDQYTYNNRPIPVGNDETISQPLIMAQQLTSLKVRPGDKILELKTGAGYQTAVMEAMGATVYTVETELPLVARLRAVLGHMETKRIRVGLAHDCHYGWPEQGPYDGIIATAAFPTVLEDLVDQLKVGARLVAPVGVAQQFLRVYEKQADGTLRQVEEPIPVMYTMIPEPS